MLETIHLFTALSEDALQALEDRAKTRRYRRNTVIMERGDEAGALFVLVSGKVRVYVADEEGKEVVLQTCDEPGTYFGELALLRNSPRTASVMTLTESEFRTISRKDFLSYLAEHPRIAQAVISHLADQVSSLTDRVTALALDDVYGRLVIALRELAQDEGGRQITPPVTQQELAKSIGASREMVSRIFKELRAGDYIRMERKRIVLNRKLPAHW